MLTKFKRYTSLKVILLAPCVIWLILLFLMIAILSYKSDFSNISILQNHFLKNISTQINQRVEKYIFDSSKGLNIGLTERETFTIDFSKNLDTFISRLWIAASMENNIDDNLYYGTKDGLFLGVKITEDGTGKIFLKLDPNEYRNVFFQKMINANREFMYKENKFYDTCNRPWFLSCAGLNKDDSSSVYIDFVSEGLVLTHANRVVNSLGEFQGVVATDQHLSSLNHFIGSLNISSNAIAYIVDSKGNFIASSFCPILKKNSKGTLTRVKVKELDNKILTNIDRQVKEQIKKANNSSIEIFSFLKEIGERMMVSYSVSQNDNGLKWISVVAFPESDFIGSINRNVLHMILLGILITILVFVIVGFIVDKLSRDLRTLSDGLNKVGEGELNHPISINRNDELGDLLTSFTTMRNKLQTDHLTCLPNRYAFEYAMKKVIEINHSNNGEGQFAVVFVDVNNFKKINDVYGHHVGDIALIEISNRLKTKIGEQNMLARLAGDEFVILFNEIYTKENVMNIIKEADVLLKQPMVIDSQTIPLYGAAMGVAYYPEDGSTFRELLSIADTRMYQHKAEVKL